MSDGSWTGTRISERKLYRQRFCLLSFCPVLEFWNYDLLQVKLSTPYRNAILGRMTVAAFKSVICIYWDRLCSRWALRCLRRLHFRALRDKKSVLRISERASRTAVTMSFKHRRYCFELATRNETKFRQIIFCFIRILTDWSYLRDRRLVKII